MSIWGKIKDIVAAIDGGSSMPAGPKTLEEAKLSVKNACQVRTETARDASYYSGCRDRIIKWGVVPECDKGQLHADYNLGVNYNIREIIQKSKTPELTAGLLAHIKEVGAKGGELIQANDAVLKTRDQLPIVYFAELRNAFVEAHIFAQVPGTTAEQKAGFFDAAKEKMNETLTKLGTGIETTRKNFDAGRDALQRISIGEARDAESLSPAAVMKSAAKLMAAKTSQQH